MEQWDETFDFVIVGSGGGSMCAALLAKSRGKRPLIIEKLDKVGGTSGFSGGILWIANNPVSKRAGVDDSFEKSRQYLDRAERRDHRHQTSLQRRSPPGAARRTGSRRGDFR